MTTKESLSAEVARNIADAYNRSVEGQLDKLLLRIKEYANKGKYEFHTGLKNFSTGLGEKLDSLGYRGDKSEGDYIVIRW